MGQIISMDSSHLSQQVLLKKIRREAAKEVRAWEILLKATGGDLAVVPTDDQREGFEQGEVEL